MAVSLTVSDRILEAMRATPERSLDDLVRTCRDFSWQEVLREVNRLNREGRLQLTLVSAKAFAVRLRAHGSPVEACDGSGPVRGG